MNELDQHKMAFIIGKLYSTLKLTGFSLIDVKSRDEAQCLSDSIDIVLSDIEDNIQKLFYPSDPEI